MAATMMMMAIAKTFNCCFCQMNGKRPAATTATAHDTNCGVLITTMGSRPGADPRLGPDPVESVGRVGCPLETSGNHNVIHLPSFALACTSLLQQRGRHFTPHHPHPFGDKATLSVSRAVDLRLCGQRAKWSTPLRVLALHFSTN